MSHRSDEVHAVAHSDFRGYRLQSILFALIAFTAVLAQDQEPDVVVLAVPQQTEGANRNLDTFEALQPADEKEHAPGAVADLATGNRAIHRLERREIDTRRHDGYTVRVGAIEGDQVLGLVGGRSDAEV